MSFTAKVKTTGQLFMATNEINDDALGKDAHKLEAGKRYAGHIFLDSRPLASPWVEFSQAEWGIFSSEELEDFYAELRLIRY